MATRILAAPAAPTPPMNMGAPAFTLEAFRAWLDARQSRALDGMTSAVQDDPVQFGRCCDQFDVAMVARRALLEFTRGAA